MKRKNQKKTEGACFDNGIQVDCPPTEENGGNPIDNEGGNSSGGNNGNETEGNINDNDTNSPNEDYNDYTDNDDISAVTPPNSNDSNGVNQEIPAPILPAGYGSSKYNGLNKLVVFLEESTITKS